jgi:ribonuclease E
VVVLSGNRLEEFDYESASKKQLKGNIYLAKITRVEPSLQAAFVDYGGNRHGFLPFSEIHPDYYRIPIADREALIREEASIRGGPVGDEDENGLAEKVDREAEVPDAAAEGEAGEADDTDSQAASNQAGEAEDGHGEDAAENGEDQELAAENGNAGNGNAENAPEDGEVEELATESGVDTLDGDEIDQAARRRARLLRRYKIQEVIKRRQVILVQVTKEERGNKGAALTTYLSLAGRYCVLMPNTGKGGGISRKISNAADRRRLKRVISDLKIPEGIAVIVRTAGSQRTKTEIRRDYEYLLRLWSEIRETTLASTAPSLIYEEASLIKRAVRDLYNSDMDEILVDGEDSYKAAKAFMKSLMPSHAKKVQLYKDPAIPLFYRNQVESQIDAMHTPVVQLKSGGYVVLNLTEALVAIDVNSGKATRERHIEGTAYKTNLEAAEEIARQLRLRDLAGLIVIDFIDMEESRHNRDVERRLKDAMRHDRARIQLGRISPFGLLEMSRQRLRPSLFESSTVVCPHCNASGFVRTTESTGLHILRALEEEGIRRGGGVLSVAVPTPIALHILNKMRSRLVEIEQRYGFRVQVETDDSLLQPNYRLERLTPVEAGREAEADEERRDGKRKEAPEGEKSERKRSRGRRRRKKDEEAAEAEDAAQAQAEAQAEDEEEAEEERAADTAETGEDEKPKRRRRRGKRGGRRRSRRRDEDALEDKSLAAGGAPGAEASGEEPPEEDTRGEESPREDVLDAAEPAETEDAEEAAEAKPKRRRSRSPRRKKAAVQSESEAVAPESVEPAESEPAAVDVEAASEEAPPAKPKRRRSPRRKKADVQAESAPDSAGEAQAEPASKPPADAEPPTADDAGSNANGEDNTGLVAEPLEPGESDAPARRGWWQRWS